MASEIVGLTSLNAHISNFARNAGQVNHEIVNEIAFGAKQILLAEGRSAAPHGLAGFAGGKGAKLNVRYDIKEFRAGSPTALIVPVPPGPWYLLEKGSPRAYVILAKGAGRARRGRAGHSTTAARARKRAAAVQGETGRGFLGNAGRGFSATSPVWHPAQRTRHTWTTGSAKAIAAGKGLWTRTSRRKYLALLGS